MYTHQVCLLLAAALSAHAVRGAEVSARQLFYDDGKKPQETAKPAVVPVKPVATAPAAKPARVKSVVPVELPQRRSEPEKAKWIGPMVANSQPPAVSAAPLALRYSILKFGGPDEMMEVDASVSYHTGDRIQIQLEGNQDGYLYMFAEGTSKNWTVLFPNEITDGGENLIRAHKPFLYPSPVQSFTFTGLPGTERLFVVLSRKPVEDINKTIYSIRDGKTTLSGGKHLDNTLIEKLKVNSRDLVIEKIQGKTELSDRIKPASLDRMSEAAVYVASPDPSPSAQVVTEIRLKHE